MDLPQDIIPTTYVSDNFDTIYSLLDTHKKIVVKPHDGAKGSNVELFMRDQNDLDARVSSYASRVEAPYIFQSYVEGIEKLGDTRVHVIDYQPVSGVRRLPPENDFRTNYSIGGSIQPARITPRIEHIVERITPFLKENELSYVGIDVFADQVLGEINLVSPGLLRYTDVLNEDTSGVDAVYSLLEKFRKTRF